MRKLAGLTMILLAVAFSSVIQAAEGSHHTATSPHDQAWVQQKVKLCASCHGKTGVSTVPTFPIIAGQYKDYLLHSLKDYRDGHRQNAVMSGMVMGLTNAQLEALATYFSRQESPLHTPTIH